jgi:hypothetical protein
MEVQPDIQQRSGLDQQGSACLPSGLIAAAADSA